MAARRRKDRRKRGSPEDPVTQHLRWLDGRPPSQALDDFQRDFSAAPLYHWSRAHDAALARARAAAVLNARECTLASRERRRRRKQKPTADTHRPGDVALSALGRVGSGNSHSDAAAEPNPWM